MNVGYLTVALFSMTLYKLELIPADHTGFAVVLSNDLYGPTTATKHEGSDLPDNIFAFFSISRCIRKYLSTAVPPTPL